MAITNRERHLLEGLGENRCRFTSMAWTAIAASDSNKMWNPLRRIYRSERSVDEVSCVSYGPYNLFVHLSIADGMHAQSVGVRNI